MKPDRALLRALHQIADQAAVDWSTLDAASPDRAGVAELRAIAGLADLHRTKALEWSTRHETPTRGARVIGVIEPVRRQPSGSSAEDGEDRWGNLVLRERLGGGAFGDVYAAYDPVLDHEVALKLLRHRDPASRAARERVFGEARALAQVTHEHVVRVYGAEEHDGRIGIWMERVRGRTLEQVLAEHGPLNAREAAIAGQDLCRALAAVHRRHLVHGDVKAQNVMREDGGRLVLMDFGAHRGRPETEGMPPSGTPLYLAPEVLNGANPSVASDVYALGVLLFRMVTRAYPVPARSHDELVEAHRLGRARRLQDLRPDLPPAFVRAIERALAPDPATRFATAGEMEAALGAVLGQPTPPPDPSPMPTPGARWKTLVAVAVLAVAAGVAGAIAWRSSQPSIATAPRSLAVLPFTTAAVDERSVSFAEGLGDLVSRRLSRLATLRVVSGASVAPRATATRDSMAAVGRSLGVTLLLEASVQLSDTTVHANVELLDTARGVVWTRRFQEPRATASGLAVTIADAALDALALERPAGGRGQRVEPQAFDAYLLGRSHWKKRTSDGIDQAVSHFRRALAVEPDFALAWSGLADAYLVAPFFGAIDLAQARREARAAAERAISIDPTIPEPHATLAQLYKLDELRWDDAGRELGRALDLDPNYPAALHWHAIWLAQRGRLGEALRQIREAVTREPDSAVLRAADAELHYYARYYGAALQKAVDAAALHGDAAHLDFIEAETLAALQRYDEALRAIDRALARSTDPGLRAWKAYILARAGRRADSERELAAMGPLADAASPFDVAAVAFVLDRPDEAFALLDRALDAHDSLIGYLAIDPRFDAFRDRAEFKALLSRVGLANTGTEVPQ